MQHPALIQQQTASLINGVKMADNTAYVTEAASVLAVEETKQAVVPNRQPKEVARIDKALA